MLAVITDQINTLNSLPTQKDSPKPPDPTTVVLDNRRAPPLDGGQSTKNCGMWNLKHDTISPKLYGILIKTEHKRYTALDLKNFYNHLNMCINAVTRLQEDLLPGYCSIKRNYEFAE